MVSFAKVSLSTPSTTLLRFSQLICQSMNETHIDVFVYVEKQR
jgi:hypothetical protein